ncbi:hypothetical protein AYI70_g6157 [Smittium culicis]|uniref:Uncharacterized protein n=1 Tax=Smittium culicis TaxID=133412 RepID=A0A1R1XR72_9FUNG|nr:hypothetical protein AYI70_g6157 [Smittium culicis]
MYYFVDFAIIDSSATAEISTNSACMHRSLLHVDNVPPLETQSNSSLSSANTFLSKCSRESDFKSTEAINSQHKNQSIDKSTPSANVDLFNFDISVDNNDKIVLSPFEKRSYKSYYTNKGDGSVISGSVIDDTNEKSTEGLNSSHRNNLSFIVNDKTPSDSIHLEILPVINENEISFDSLKLSHQLNNCEINSASKITNKIIPHGANDLATIIDIRNDDEIPDVLSNDRNYHIEPLNNEMSSDSTSCMPCIPSIKSPEPFKSIQSASSVNSLETISCYYTQIAAILFCELGWNLTISGQNLFARCDLCYRELSLRLFTPFTHTLSNPETPQSNSDYIIKEVPQNSDIPNLGIRMLNVNNEHYQFCYYQKN